MPSAIRVDGAWKEFPLRGEPQPQVVLAGISFDIAEGEFVCLLGPSGCGKSTLLKIVAGLVRPSSGGMRINGQPVSGPGPDRAVSGAVSLRRRAELEVDGRAAARNSPARPP